MSRVSIKHLDGRLRARELRLFLGLSLSPERLVSDGADHSEGRIVGRPRLRGHFVLGRLGRREQLVEHHDGIFDGHIWLQPDDKLNEVKLVSLIYR